MASTSSEPPPPPHHSNQGRNKKVQGDAKEDPRALLSKELAKVAHQLVNSFELASEKTEGFFNIRGFGHETGFYLKHLLHTDNFNEMVQISENPTFTEMQYIVNGYLNGMAILRPSNPDQIFGEKILNSVILDLNYTGLLKVLLESQMVPGTHDWVITHRPLRIANLRKEFVASYTERKAAGLFTPVNCRRVFYNPINPNWGLDKKGLPQTPPIQSYICGPLNQIHGIDNDGHEYRYAVDIVWHHVVVAINDLSTLRPVHFQSVCDVDHTGQIILHSEDEMEYLELLSKKLESMLSSDKQAAANILRGKKEFVTKTCFTRKKFYNQLPSRPTFTGMKTAKKGNDQVNGFFKTTSLTQEVKNPFKAFYESVVAKEPKRSNSPERSSKKQQERQRKFEMLTEIIQRRNDYLLTLAGVTAYAPPKGKSHSADYAQPLKSGSSANGVVRHSY